MQGGEQRLGYIEQNMQERSDRIVQIAQSEVTSAMRELQHTRAQADDIIATTG
jgi:hypothetical protein